VRLTNLTSSSPLLLGAIAAALLVAAVACGNAAGVSAPIAAAESPKVEAKATGESAPTTSPSLSPTPSPTLGAVGTGIPGLQELAEQGFRQLVDLTEKHSPRQSATSEEAAAAENISTLLSGFGYATELRPFTIDLVRTDPSVLRVHSSDPPDGRAFPLTLSGEGEASGPLAAIGRALLDDVAAVLLTGRVALIERGVIPFEEKVARAQEAGAVAVIIYNNRRGNFAGRLSTRSAIPAVSVSREMGEVEVTVSVVVEARDSANVVADLPGTDPEAGMVVLGGHYDTVAGVTGANDNGSGIAALLTVARHAADRPYPFALRFIAFGAEEEGLIGSREYVDSLNVVETRSIIAMFNFDALGTGDVAAMIATAWLGELVLELGDEIGVTVRLDPDLGLDGGSSDFAPFEAAGVPFVFFFADDFSRIHTVDDKLDYVDPARIGEAAALGLATLEALAAGR
jgi:aminopeptidase YwaD